MPRGKKLTAEQRIARQEKEDREREKKLKLQKDKNLQESKRAYIRFKKCQDKYNICESKYDKLMEKNLRTAERIKKGKLR